MVKAYPFTAGCEKDVGHTSRRFQWPHMTETIDCPSCSPHVPQRPNAARNSITGRWLLQALPAGLRALRVGRRRPIRHPSRSRAAAQGRTRNAACRYRDRVAAGLENLLALPGDSGVPPHFDFDKSENAEIVIVAWPAAACASPIPRA